MEGWPFPISSPPSFMLSRVSMMCFAASYGVAFVVELLRASGKLKVKAIWAWFCVLAGLLAHTSYLVMQAQEGMAVRGALLSSWYHWCLIGSWALALIGLMISFSRPQSAVGVFLLPLVLGLIAVASAMPKDELFAVTDATRAWGMLHGVGLLLGMVSVMVGFATGLMYLIQSRRLKKKIPLGRGLKLPSLEWLGHANERSLLWSTFCLTMGVLSGIVLNLAKLGIGDGLAWSDPTVWTSALLVVWLVLVTIFSLIYKPARMGRKVAYLTVANFVILTLTMGIVLFGPSEHAVDAPVQAQNSTVSGGQS